MSIETEKGGMKKTLLRTLKELLNKEVDLRETPALFVWRYEEVPGFEFQMLIKESEVNEQTLVH